MTFALRKGIYQSNNKTVSSNTISILCILSAMTSCKENILLLLFSAILLMGCSSINTERTVADGGKLMLSADLERIVSGNTLYMYEYDSNATVKFFKNGGLLGKNNHGTASKGKWYINGNDKLCLTFKKWGHGDLICYSVYQIGDEYRQFSPGGLLAGSFTVVSDIAPDNSDQEADETAEPVDPSAISIPAVVSAPGTSPSLLPEKEAIAKQEHTTASTVEKARNCPGCDLQKANLADANLTKAVLPGANLTGANLQGATLKMANLKGATLKGADLSNANLAGADLAGADLTGADLTGTELFGTTLKGATLDGVIGADFMGAIQ
jgi:hypothetical protein